MPKDIQLEEIRRKKTLKGCIRPCKSWDELPINWLTGFLNHQQFEYDYVELMYFTQHQRIFHFLLSEANNEDHFHHDT